MRYRLHAWIDTNNEDERPTQNEAIYRIVRALSNNSDESIYCLVEDHPTSEDIKR